MAKLHLEAFIAYYQAVPEFRRWRHAQKHAEKQRQRQHEKEVQVQKMAHEKYVIERCQCWS